MKREAPVLTNKVKTMVDLLPMLPALIVLSAGLLTASNYEVLFLVTETGELKTKYAFFSPALVLAISFLAAGVFAVMLVITSFIQNSYLELYRKKVYLLPIEPVTWKNLKTFLFGRTEKQPEIFPFEEISEIQNNGNKRVTVRLKNGLTYSCYARKKFAAEVVGAFAEKGRRE